MLPSFKRPIWFLFFGVILPFFAILVECYTGACASLMMSPTATPLHVLLLLVVPAFHLWFWWLLRRAAPLSESTQHWLGFGYGASAFMAISTLLLMWHVVYISCLFGPLVCFIPKDRWLSFFAIFGASPLWTAFSSLSAGHKTRQIPESRKTVKWGALAAIIALGLAEVPHWVSLLGSPPPTQEANYLWLQRTFGHERTLHAQAVGQPFMSPLRFQTDFIYNSAFTIFRPRNTESAQELYYRVTGKSFSEQPFQQKIDLRNLNDEVNNASDWVWDGDRGSGDIGARIRGLTLKESAMTWELEPAGAMAYGEWTLVFHNTQANEQEARTQIRLPAGAVVSRLTLWVNGTPQEAAFDAKEKVTAAYQQVVRVERRDPVLVNQVGPDRIMLQCFPVPPAGGEMKVRVGITAPTHQPLALPCMIARNFSLPEDLTHHVELRGTEQKHLKLAHADLESYTLPATEKEAAAQVWTRDEKQTPPILLREQRSSQPEPWGSIIAVVDTSIKLRPFAAAIRSSLASLAEKQPVKVVLATDTGFLSGEGKDLDTLFSQESFVGGKDNRRALEEAIRLAQHGSEKHSCILWFHGPQPVKVKGTDSILTFNKEVPITIFPISLADGENHVLEWLYRKQKLQPALQVRDSQALAATVTQVARGIPEQKYHYTRVATPPASAKEVSSHLARLWVYEQILRSFTGAEHLHADLAKLASTYQLVTPYSGAVVLERVEQYKAAGLSQVDSSTVPQLRAASTPEPSGAMLLLSASLYLLLRRRR